MFGKPVHTLQSATSGWRDLWLNTGANLFPSYSPLQQTPRACPVFTRGRWFRPSPKPSQTFSSQWQLLFDCWRRTSNRLGDLQISKIKRLANLNLSLDELLNSKWTWVFSRDLPWDAHNICVWEYSAEQPTANGGWVRGIYRWQSRRRKDGCDPMRQLDACPQRSDFWSKRNFSCGARKLTHRVSSLSKAQSAMTLPSSNNSLLSEISLVEILSGFWLSRAIHFDLDLN